MQTFWNLLYGLLGLGIDEASKIKIARLESSGDISFILAEKSS